MPETEENKTIDIDTSGPEVEVKLPEEKTKEEDKTYESSEDNIVTSDSSEEPSQQSDVRVEENKTQQGADEKGSDKQQDNRKEVEEYSEGVKKRIAKLTKKMREAERQREEAVNYAKSVQTESDQLKAKLQQVAAGYLNEYGGRITAEMAQAQEDYKRAIATGDPDKSLEAQQW